ncbi:hypothetical protein JKI95_09980 [Corynebacterium aquatimens]|nr:hypothetical protein JKI95_09980 [Corynebacterium aquatimens]
MQYDVCVVGLGYIGLPTAILLAKSGKRLSVSISTPIGSKPLLLGPLRFQSLGWHHFCRPLSTPPSSKSPQNLTAVKHSSLRFQLRLVRTTQRTWSLYGRPWSRSFLFSQKAI